MSFEHDFPMKVRDAFGASHEPEAQHLLANVYWSTLISFFVVTAVLFVAFGLWEFLGAPMPENVDETPRPQTALSRATLQETLEGLDARTTRFEERTQTAITVRDPS